MLALRPKAVRAAERIPTAVSRGTRRHASSHGADHGHHAGPKEESLGPQLWVLLAAVPISVGVYTISRPDKNGKTTGLTQLIDKYSSYKEAIAARNTLHTDMCEQAAFDSNLYKNSKETKHVDLRFPEIFNTGSPYNVVAGQGARGIDEMVAHYQKVNADADERRTKALAAKEN
ncbi:NADH-ubiquinone oxidoreductase 17.8 kDa subunit [Lachnellula arida]|uniref:NADH-ubiquinone oxidoreductase 17.8 kDa subunit n=2 Tax=Lachnellula TaxID=47830 RepID=A0A8T9B7U2_9HELO|nr:NADH-ubiquinone oxidoreductase 17.8 kDa subunit [Lachnellula arida]TVY89993.1 NADH-ubiquinone oxidoreductase 17.8 kDa subunit, mitochondrial [Lachnellula willkommii]